MLLTSKTTHYVIMRVNLTMVSTSSFTGSSQPRKKGATLAGTHVPRLFDHLLASRVVRRCPHCFWAWPAVFKFARFELGASPNPGVHRWVRARGREREREIPSGPWHYEEGIRACCCPEVETKERARCNTAGVQRVQNAERN